MCGKLGIVSLMQFNKDFDAEMVVGFFTTVHLGIYEAMVLTWMTNGRLLSALWKEITGLLGYDDKGIHDPIGFRPHEEIASIHKSQLYPFSQEKISSTTRKSTYVLKPFLDIMHHIFRHTVFPRVGNLDQVVQLRKKDKWATYTARGMDLPEDEDEEDDKIPMWSNLAPLFHLA
ncbi:hypothetical protein D1007_01960 [Hordeum vulgare]|nr:hypothetical protein D1007_01960 [Hordeum vulgare]